jgi:hypothetical protein
MNRLVLLILRSALFARVSKDRNGEHARWFETREDALLTMRNRKFLK